MNETEGFKINGTRFLRSGQLKVDDDAVSVNTSNDRIQEAGESLLLDVDRQQFRQSLDFNALNNNRGVEENLLDAQRGGSKEYDLRSEHSYQVAIEAQTTLNGFALPQAARNCLAASLNKSIKAEMQKSLKTKMNQNQMPRYKQILQQQQNLQKTRLDVKITVEGRSSVVSQPNSGDPFQPSRSNHMASPTFRPNARTASSPSEHYLHSSIVPQGQYESNAYAPSVFHAATGGRKSSAHSINSSQRGSKVKLSQPSQRSSQKGAYPPYNSLSSRQQNSSFGQNNASYPSRPLSSSSQAMTQNSE